MSKIMFTQTILEDIFPQNGFINQDYIELFKQEDGFRDVLCDDIWEITIANQNSNEHSFLFKGKQNLRDYLLNKLNNTPRLLTPEIYTRGRNDLNKGEQLQNYINNTTIENKKNLYYETYFKDSELLFQNGEFPEINGLTIHDIRNIQELWNNNQPKFISNPIDDKDKLINLLFAVIWKNGDVNKVVQLLEGINNINDGDRFVFRYFGDFLNQNVNYQKPIIDQHVLRAFYTWKNLNMENHIDNDINVNTNIWSEEIDVLVTSYLNWFTSIMNNFPDLDNNIRYNINRNIDKTLFSIGRVIK